MSKYTTPEERIQELVRLHGSYRAAAKSTGASYTFLYRVANNGKQASDNLLRKIGLERHVVYMRTGKFIRTDA